MTFVAEVGFFLAGLFFTSLSIIKKGCLRTLARKTGSARSEIRFTKACTHGERGGEEKKTGNPDTHNEHVKTTKEII